MNDILTKIDWRESGREVSSARRAEHDSGKASGGGSRGGTMAALAGFSQDGETSDAGGADCAPARVRLLFLIRALSQGGAERQLIELVRGLDKIRFEITVATFYDGGSLWPEMIAIDGIRVVSLKKKGRWDLGMFIARFCRLVREVKPHVTHGYMGISNELGLLARGISGSRAFWGIRGSGCDYSSYEDWARGFGHRVGAWLSRYADRIIVNSEAGREEHVADGYAGERMIVVRNGIDTVRFCPDREAGEHVRREWGISRETPLIGLVGRLDPMKDHTTFLRAAALMAKRRPDVHFVCVGNGPESYLWRLQALAGGLCLDGRLLWQDSRRDICAVYNALTILTSSSCFGEGFSNCIGEAMACGTSVAATDVGDASKIVNDPQRIVPPGNPGALAEAWQRLLDLPPEAVAEQACELRERIVTHFSLSRLVKQTEAAILDALS